MKYLNFLDIVNPFCNFEVYIIIFYIFLNTIFNMKISYPMNYFNQDVLEIMNMIKLEKPNFWEICIIASNYS